MVWEVIVWEVVVWDVVSFPLNAAGVIPVALRNARVKWL
jgi:hypothetical protein